MKEILRRYILFKKNRSMNLEVYINTDYMRSMINWRSTSSYFNLFSGNIITWDSKKQQVIAMSSAGYKFHKWCKIGKLLWLNEILEYLNLIILLNYTSLINWL